MFNDLQSHRGRVFFWIGLGILPVFWLWWMRLRDFSASQIRTARIWTIVYILGWAIAWLCFPVLRNRVFDLQWTYSHVAFQIGLVLWLWLLLRTVFRGLTFVEIIFGFIICTDIIAIMSGQMHTMLQTFLPHPSSIMFILVPSFIHLLVGPLEKLGARVTGTQKDDNEELE